MAVGGAEAWSIATLFAAPARRRPHLSLRADRALDIAPSLGTSFELQRLAALVEETADRLRGLGIGGGDRVVVIKRQNLDIPILTSAIRTLGAVPALLAPDSSQTVYATLLQRLQFPHVITDAATRAAGVLPESDLPALASSLTTIDGGGLETVRLHPGEPREHVLPATVGLITHTSGTTGVPKLIGYEERNIAAHTAIQVRAARLFRVRGRGMGLLSFVHGRMFSSLGTTFAIGMPAVYLTNPDPAMVGPAIAEEKPDLVETFPNVFLHWESLAQHEARPFSTVKFFASTFDAIHPRSIHTLLRASDRRFPVYLQGYGTTETGPMTMMMYTRWHRIHGRCVGYPIPGFSRVRVKRRPGDSLGYIETRARGAAPFYIGEPERVAPGSARTWWRTGDLGYRSRWGCIHMVDREVDEPPEVRSALITEDRLLEALPGASEVLVLPMGAGLPLPVVCTADGAALPDAAWRRAAEGLALAPPVYCGWDSVPRTSTWKVRRLELRRRIDEGRFQVHPAS